MAMHRRHPPLETLADSPILLVVVGAALLCAGRKLFWLFIAAIGFFGAMRFASEYLADQPREWVLIGSLLAGALGALLAIFVQKVAITVSGAVAGAYLLDLLFRSGVLPYPEHGWIFLLIAAVAGAILMTYLFRWALIILSSIAGAQLISQTLPFGSQGATISFILLAIVGVVIQSRSGSAARS